MGAFSYKGVTYDSNTSIKQIQKLVAEFHGREDSDPDLKQSGLDDIFGIRIDGMIELNSIWMLGNSYGDYFTLELEQFIKSRLTDEERKDFIASESLDKLEFLPKVLAFLPKDEFVKKFDNKDELLKELKKEISSFLQNPDPARLICDRKSFETNVPAADLVEIALELRRAGYKVSYGGTSSGFSTACQSFITVIW